MNPFDHVRAELVQLGASPRTMEVFERLILAFGDRAARGLSWISPMTPEQALARLSVSGDPEAIGVLSGALQELADVKALDLFLDAWGDRARYAVRRNPLTPKYSVIFYTGRFPSFSLPPIAHGGSPVYARRTAASEVKRGI